ncbi:unnamed protein product [Paramecium primaurelia]|uniref:UBC core domain-containing protein n=2 Tax=Paramecium TaxID=5884 RepID=A0A8S1TZX0_9CILI|nr:unnamed protein product [Paramecium primaurelia]CAD8156206.1 unnamed protein product [Paramecium pentaurelia]
MQNRLNKELQDLTQTSPIQGVQITADANNRLLWTAIVAGPEGTAYQGGKFKLTITFPENYPFKAPQFLFTTKIFHPNITEKGEFCEDMIETKEQWQPTKTVKQVLEKILNIMGQVNTEQGLNQKALELYKSDKGKYEETVRSETQKYAQ